MSQFVPLSVFAAALLSGVLNYRSYTGNSSALIVSSVVDAFNFQHPLTRTTRRRGFCSLDRTPPFVQKTTSWAFSESKVSLRRNRSSSTTVGATRIPTGDKSGAKDRNEDLRLTIEIIMQFIGNTHNDVPAAGESPTQDVPKRRPPVDHKMQSKYEELALLVKREVERTSLGQQHQQIHEGANGTEQQQQQQPSPATWWCAIVGGPGAGKSTLARRVATMCNDELGIPSIVVPMDGYFFSRSELETQLKLDPRGRMDYLRRRGSPHTINTEKLCEDLAVASGKRLHTDPFSGPFGNGAAGGWGENENNDEANLAPQPFAFPSYRRTAPSDPLPKQIHFDPSYHRVVFVEGEYLLLGKGGMVPGYVTETESKRWKPLLALFDATWFVTCQPEPQSGANDNGDEDETQVWYNYDFEEQRKRRLSYHLEEDEDDEETLQSLFPSLSSPGTKGGEGSTVPLSKDDVAAKRVDSNDVLNMLIAETSQQHASLVIRSV